MEKHTNDPSMVSNTLELDDILTRIFAAVIEVCPSAVGSTLFVSKKWHKNIRKRMLWIKNPLLSHIAHENTEDLVSYSKLEEYVLELKILEHSAEIKCALRKKKTAELRKMKVATSSTISVQGLKRIKIFDTFDEEERLSFKRLYDTSYLLGCSESYSSLNVIDSFHVFISASWLTFLSDEHWIALFLLFEANQQTDVKPLIVVKGSTTSPEIEMFDLRERFNLREEEFSSNKANEAIKELYEFSDEEWSKVPEPKYYHVLSILSGLKRDFLHP